VGPAVATAAKPAAASLLRGAVSAAHGSVRSGAATNANARGREKQLWDKPTRKSEVSGKGSAPAARASSRNADAEGSTRRGRSAKGGSRGKAYDVVSEEDERWQPWSRGYDNSDDSDVQPRSMPPPSQGRNRQQQAAAYRREREQWMAAAAAAAKASKADGNGWSKASKADGDGWSAKADGDDNWRTTKMANKGYSESSRWDEGSSNKKWDEGRTQASSGRGKGGKGAASGRGDKGAASGRGKGRGAAAASVKHEEDEEDEDLEAFEEGAGDLVTKKEAKKMYCLPEGTLQVCAVVEKDNPRNSHWTKMKLYSRSELRRRARKRHGGKEGLIAERRNREDERFRNDIAKTKDIFKS